MLLGFFFFFVSFISVSLSFQIPFILRFFSFSIFLLFYVFSSSSSRHVCLIVVVHDAMQQSVWKWFCGMPKTAFIRMQQHKTHWGLRIEDLKIEDGEDMSGNEINIKSYENIDSHFTVYWQICICKRIADLLWVDVECWWSNVMTSHSRIRYLHDACNHIATTHKIISISKVLFSLKKVSEYPVTICSMFDRMSIANLLYSNETDFFHSPRSNMYYILMNNALLFHWIALFEFEFLIWSVRNTNGCSNAG